MDRQFVVHQQDPRGLKAAAVLQGLGENVTILTNGGAAPPSAIALFGHDGGQSGGRYRNGSNTRVATHTFADRGFVTPAWAETTPFRVAIKGTEPKGQSANFVESMRQIVRCYKKWNPWMQSPAAPWEPRWHEGSPHRNFEQWKSQARLVVPAESQLERVSAHLTPVYPVSELTADTLVVTGCAVFNKAHTDLADRLADGKGEQVVTALANLISDGGFTKVRFLAAGGEVSRHPMLRDHLHQFMTMDVDEIERLTGESLGEQVRLSGDRSERSWDSVAESFELGAVVLRKEIIAPLKERTNVAIEEVSWLDLLGPYLDIAYGAAQELRDRAKAIYDERVKSRPQYARLYMLDPEAGLRRTIANMGIYIAMAMYVAENAGHVIATCEHLDTYWKGLEEPIQKFLAGREPLIGIVAENIRHPWGY